MSRIALIPPLFIGLLILTSCAESAHQVQRQAELLGLSPELAKQIDTSVTFVDLQAAPAHYIGRVVMIGGIVIGSKRTKERTEIEVLELPTRDKGPATTDRLQSKGRFLAVREEFLDPASIPPGTPISVVAVVAGSVTKILDDSEYTYPVLDIRQLIDWNTVAGQQTESGSAAFYGPASPPFGYWGRPYGYAPHFGRPGPYFYQPQPSSPPPPPPPPHQIPPRFRRR
jgi:outer membrane lipoprotein